MKTKQKIVNLIAVTSCLGLIGASYGSSLPLLDARKITIKQNIRSLKKLSFSQFVSDSEIDLSNGNLQDKDLPALVEFLKNHPTINTVNLSGNNELTAKSLVPLAFLTTLKSLDLARNYKECPDGKCIGGLEDKDIAPFANNTTLTSLNLFMHSLTDKGAIALAKNAHLKELNIGCNEITDVGGLVLAESQSIENLGLQANNEITSKTAIALSKNQVLQKLHMGQTHILDDGVRALAKQSRLKDLKLSFTNVGDDGAFALSENKNLENLELSGTKVSLVGAKALAKNQTLQSLLLAGDFSGFPRPNDFGDEAAIAFAQNHSLTNLDLSSQQITKVGAEALGKMNQLKNLYLARNYKIGDDGVAALTRAHGAFDHLDVSACGIKDKGAETLAKYNFKQLDANSNFIGDAGVYALSINDSIPTLNLSINDIQDEGAYALSRSKIKSLDVTYNLITMIGNTMLLNNPNFDVIKVGDENPYLSPNGYDKKIFINSKFKSSKNHQSFCFRTNNAVHCVNKHAILFSPSP